MVYSGDTLRIKTLISLLQGLALTLVYIGKLTGH
jgi:hypothetical protein